MGIYGEVADYDDDFLRFVKDPQYVNDVDESPAAKEAFRKEVFTQHDGSECLSNTPTCQCGRLTGYTNSRGDKTSGSNIGVKCPVCHTTVESSTDDLQPRIWLRSPRGVTAMINPLIWSMLVGRFKKGAGFSLLHWITMPSYVPDGNLPVYWQSILDAKLKRGYNNFVENFDSYMEFFFNLKTIKKRNKIDPLYQLIQENRNKVFSQQIPLVNRTMLVIENTNLGRFLDNTMFVAIDAITGMIGIDTPTCVLSQRQREERTIKSIDMLSQYYEGVYDKLFAPKEGIFRKQVYGGRTDFSARCVISSLTGPHQYDEIHIPWGVGIGLLRTHLASKLTRRGYNPNDLLGLLYSAVGTTDKAVIEKVKSLFDEMIEESDCSYLYPDDPDKHKGIPVIMQRNPTLGLGSIQLVRITGIKDDLEDKTMSISILNVEQYGADRHLKYRSYLSVMVD